MDKPTQQQIKQELVDAIRMLERAEYIDHNGHCSVRRDAGSFYINSGASQRACLTVEDIVAVDLDGRPVDGSNVKPPLEFPIHAEVYRARPAINAVFHTHPQWSTYLTMTGVPQKVVHFEAEEAPLEIVVAMDISGSMGIALEDLASATTANARRRFGLGPRAA